MFPYHTHTHTHTDTHTHIHLHLPSGSHVMTELSRVYPDCLLVCYDKLSYCGRRNNFKHLIPETTRETAAPAVKGMKGGGRGRGNSNFVFVKGDISNQDLLKQIFQAYQIDTVLHFAAGNEYNHKTTLCMIVNLFFVCECLLCTCVAVC